jgi:hypothetical protein
MLMLRRVVRKWATTDKHQKSDGNLNPVHLRRSTLLHPHHIAPCIPGWSVLLYILLPTIQGVWQGEPLTLTHIGALVEECLRMRDANRSSVRTGHQDILFVVSAMGARERPATLVKRLHAKVHAKAGRD